MRWELFLFRGLEETLTTEYEVVLAFLGKRQADEHWDTVTCVYIALSTGHLFSSIKLDVALLAEQNHLTSI